MAEKNNIDNNIDNNEEISNREAVLKAKEAVWEAREAVLDGNKASKDESGEIDYSVFEGTNSESGTVREEIRNQKAKVAKMPFKKRLQHFWYYYKIPVFILIGLIAFGVYLFLHYTYFADKPPVLSVYALNSSYAASFSEDEKKALNNFIAAFAEKEGIDLKSSPILINTGIVINTQTKNTFDLATDMNVVSNGENHNVDLIMGSPELVDYYVPNEFYDGTVDNHLPADFYEYLKENDCIYYFTDDDGNKYAMGVYLRKAPRFAETGLYNAEIPFEPVAAPVSAYSLHMDMVVDFLEYLYDFR